MNSYLPRKLSSRKFCKPKMSFGRLPRNLQPSSVRDTKEEKFMKELRETEDMLTWSRWSSLSLVRFWTSLFTTDVSKLTQELPERSSEDNWERWDNSSGTWPSKTESERLRYLNSAKRPNPEEIRERKRALKARLRRCKWGRRKRLALEGMVP